MNLQMDLQSNIQKTEKLVRSVTSNSKSFRHTTDDMSNITFKQG